MLVACPLKFFEKGLENFAGDRVGIIEVVVYRSFLTNVDVLCGIEVHAFYLKL